MSEFTRTKQLVPVNIERLESQLFPTFHRQRIEGVTYRLKYADLVQLAKDEDTSTRADASTGSSGAAIWNAILTLVTSMMDSSPAVDVEVAVSIFSDNTIEVNVENGGRDDQDDDDNGADSKSGDEPDGGPDSGTDGRNE